MDGFVLRFPRTGVVNYVYNSILELVERNEFDLTVLVEDMNFSDAEISYFAKASLKTQLVERFVKAGRLNQLVEKFRNRGLSVRLPTPTEVSRVVAPGDIYHATDWYYYPVRHARGNVITYHDLTAKLFSRFHEKTNIVKESRKAKAVRDFDHIVAVSNSTRNDLINYLNVPPSKVSVSHLGVDRIYDAPTRLSREGLLAKYNIDPSRRYILSVSTIEPRKNIIGILNAYRILCAEHPAYRDVHLVLSGHMGWRNQGLNEFMASYPNRDNVVFIGYVPLEDMPSLYFHAEAFVYLSFYEGFGIPILEAMKSSCPVVCSNTSSMPEVLGDSGELVSPHSPEQAASAVARILDDSCYANSLRFAGFARSKSFTWKKHVEDLSQIYGAF
ncbi:MAG: glycosyltransferase family 4 protein [Proteobacteria bacterium]|nr:glycosyltransferase family 4 protein [Pseudomonadota bacterium]